MRKLLLGIALGVILATGASALAASTAHWPAACKERSCVNNHLNALHTQVTSQANLGDRRQAHNSSVFESIYSRLGALENQPQGSIVIGRFDSDCSPLPNNGVFDDHVVSTALVASSPTTPVHCLIQLDRDVWDQRCTTTVNNDLAGDGGPNEEIMSASKAVSTDNVDPNFPGYYIDVWDNHQSGTTDEFSLTRFSISVVCEGNVS